MTKLEQALEIVAREAAAEGATDGSQWKLVFNLVGQRALTSTSWRHDMFVEPVSEWPLDHAICEHDAGFVGYVLCLDRLPKRPHFDPQDDSRTDIE